MGFKDNVHFDDRLRVSLETEPVAPRFPCPECGSETKPHGERTHEGDATRICSGPLCRSVQPAPNKVPRSGPGDDRPWYPCAQCGRETLVHHVANSVQSKQRVCSAPDCRTIVTG